MIPRRTCHVQISITGFDAVFSGHLPSTLAGFREFQDPYLKITSTILLFLWGLIAVLGPAGLHALAESCGVCCVKDSVRCNPCSRSHQKNVDQRSHDCCSSSSHGHKTASHSSEAERHHGKESAPCSHDAGNCLICDWYMQCQSTSLTFVQVINEAAFEYQVPVACSHRVVCIALPASSRGPPLA
jgi:hypothetical protein